MGKLEGGLIIAVALLLLWIGITGRGEALMAAIGMIRKAPGTEQKKVSANVLGTMPLDFGTIKAA